MGATAEPAAEQSMAARLGLKAGQVVQEFGYDEDVDDDLRLAIETLTGNELADEDAQDVVDAALYWWRDGDGDLVDSLVDALTNLVDGGVIWLLTPKAGRARRSTAWAAIAAIRAQSAIPTPHCGSLTPASNRVAAVTKSMLGFKPLRCFARRHTTSNCRR